MKKKGSSDGLDSSGLGSFNADDDKTRQTTHTAQTQPTPINDSEVVLTDRSQIDECYRILAIPSSSQRPSSPRTSDQRLPVSASSKIDDSEKKLAYPRARRLSAPPALKKTAPVESWPGDHIKNLLERAQQVMHLSTQFLYRILRDTESAPDFDIFSLRKHENADIEAIAATRSGILLLQIINNSALRVIFKERRTDTKDITAESGDTLASSIASLPRVMKIRNVQITLNPFFSRAYQLVIPSNCLKKVEHCATIEHYLHQDSTNNLVENSGIFSSFQKNPDTLKSFIEMHALLQQIANAFLACDEARELLSIAGLDILTHSDSHTQFISLMVTLEGLCEALIRSQQRLFIIAEQTLNDARNSDWATNFDKIPNIKKQFQQATQSCIDQIKSTRAAAIEQRPSAHSEQSCELITSFSQAIKKFTEQAKKLLELTPSTTQYAGNEQAQADQTIATSVIPAASPPQSPRTRALSKARLFKTVTPKSSPKFVPDSAPCIPPAFRANPHAQVAAEPLARKSAQADLEASQIVLLQEREKFFNQKMVFRGGNISEEKTLCRLLTDANIAIVKDCLRLTPLEKLLDLGNNDVRGPGATWLCQFLLTHSRLESLDMSENLQLFAQLPDPRAKGTETLSSCAGAVAFAELVAKHPALKSLSLIKCGLNTHSATVLFGGLSQNKTLEVLYLGSNDLGDDGVIALCSALTNHPTLHTLSLARNTLETCGPALVELLKNSRIVCLDIYANYFSDEAFDQIIDQLAVNRTKYGDVKSSATSTL